MKKSPLKEILLELLNEAPKSQASSTVPSSASDVFQKVPFGHPINTGKVDFPRDEVVKVMEDFIVKRKIPKKYADIVRKLPDILEVEKHINKRMDVFEAVRMEFMRIFGGHFWSASTFKEYLPERKKLFPNDWEDMAARIKNIDAVKTYKFKDGTTFEKLQHIVYNMADFMYDYLVDRDTGIAFPDLKSDFKLPDERNTPYENELGTALRSWFGSSNIHSAETFKKYYAAIQQAKTKFPKVFNPGKEKSPAYRGTALSAQMKTALQKSKREDWIPSKIGSYPYMVYTIPVKYTPKRFAQSWTTKSKITTKFGNGSVLITGISDQFFLNPKSSYALNSHEYAEDEIIHLGDAFKYPVYIALRKSIWESLFDSKTTGSDISKIAKGLVNPTGTTTTKKPAVKKQVTKKTK